MELINNRRISIRNIEEKDITSIVDYFLNANINFLISMGVNPDKMPKREDWIEMLKNECFVSIPSKKYYFVIWMLNDIAIGHSNLTNIIYNEEAFMHFHIWDSSARKAGIGTKLIRITLKHYIVDFGIKQLHCEPYAFNSAPNKVLEKVGFDFIKEYLTTPGWLCFEQPVKKWLLTAEKFHMLNSLQPPFKPGLINDRVDQSYSLNLE